MKVYYVFNEVWCIGNFGNLFVIMNFFYGCDIKGIVFFV